MKRMYGSNARKIETTENYGFKELTAQSWIDNTPNKINEII